MGFFHTIFLSEIIGLEGFSTVFDLKSLRFAPKGEFS